MKIDRNNYEEYFLLYADDELTDGEKIEVLQFIRAHKDLEEEFKMILDTICKPDDIRFENKKSLLKRETGELMSENNCEEFFLLYHDGELNEEQESQVKWFINGHENFRKDFETIGIARMLPEDSVRFPGKKYLYKKENAGKVISVTFKRFLAAAVLIGFGLWLFLYQGKQGTPLVVIENAVPVHKSLPDANKDTKPAEQVASTLQPREEEVKASEKMIEAPQKKQSKVVSKAAERVLPGIVATTIKNKKVNEEINLKSVTKDIHSDVAITLTDPPGYIPKTIESVDNQVADPEKKNQEIVENNRDETVPVQQASFANDNTENYVFYNVTTDDFRKTKVGGFLKKVKRVVERTNPISRLLSGDEKEVVSNRQFIQ